MDIEKIRVRIMSEAYDLADRGDLEGFNAIKVMCNEVLEATEDIINELSLLKDQRVLVIQTVEKIIEGCTNVREDKDLHKDVHHLARLVKQDCLGLLMFIKEEDK